MSVVIRLKVPIEMHYTVIPMGTSKVNSSRVPVAVWQCYTSNCYTRILYFTLLIAHTETHNSTQLNEHVRTQVLTPQCPHLFNTTTVEHYKQE